MVTLQGIQLAPEVVSSDVFCIQQPTSGRVCRCLPPTAVCGAQVLNTFVDQSLAINVYFSHT